MRIVITGAMLTVIAIIMLVFCVLMLVYWLRERKRKANERVDRLIRQGMFTLARQQEWAARVARYKQKRSA